MDMLSMELNHHWAQVPTIFPSQEQQSQTNWLHIIRSLDRAYLSKAFVRMRMSTLLNLPVDPLTNFPHNYKVTVHTYQYNYKEPVADGEQPVVGGDQPVAGEEELIAGGEQLLTVKLKRRSKMLLRNFIKESKSKNEITLIEWITDKKDSSYEFKYVNSETFTDQVDYKSVGFGWDLYNNGIGGKKYPGINIPFLYIGCPGAVAPLHLEEANLRSINIHLGGADKIWFGIENEDIPKLEQLLSKLKDCKGCPTVYRHKLHFWDTELLTEHGIRVYKTVQKKGDIIITNSLHQVINLGYNVNIAVNFWVGGSELEFTQNGKPCPTKGFTRKLCSYPFQSTILNRFVTKVAINFPCIDQYCHDVFHSKTNLRTHVRNKHDMEVPVDTKADCPICYKTFSKPESHLKSAHGHLLSVYCVLCRKKKTDMAALRKHWRDVHKAKEDFRCKNCNIKVAKSFKDAFHEHDECLEN